MTTTSPTLRLAGPAAATGSTDGAAPGALSRARAAVSPALRSALDRLNPELQQATSFHLEGGGKFVRAALVIVSGAACGAREPDVLPGAVALELVHNFSLVHDDIIDGDSERRHRPTLWAEYGVGHALIAGDAMLALALQVLLDDPTPARAGAALRLAGATQAMIGGQAEDMVAELRPSLSLEECLRMEAGKTGALLACAASLGAVLAGAGPATVQALEDFGLSLGIAFQAIDDVLGIWGDPVVTGKPVGSDLRSHKKTLPIALASGDPATSPELARTLAGDLSDEDVDRATALLERSGARQATLALADARLQSALAALERVPLVDGPKRELAAIARYVTARDR